MSDEPAPAPSPASPVPDAPTRLLPEDVNGELLKIRYQATVNYWLAAKAHEAAEAAALTALNAAQAATDRANEAALLKSVHDAYIATAQSSLDRAMTRVNYVTGAIAAVTTIYTGLLGLVYSAATNAKTPLRTIALIPPVFLGLALLLVTIWAAMFKKAYTARVSFLATNVGGPVMPDRVRIFMWWCANITTARLWALHAGIVSFGLGVATLPLPFLKIRTWIDVVILAIGLVLVAAAGLAADNGIGLPTDLPGGPPIGPTAPDQIARTGDAH